MVGNLLYNLGSCERRNKYTKEMCIPFRPIPKARHSSPLTFLSSGYKLTDNGRPKYLIENKSNTAEYASSEMCSYATFVMFVHLVFGLPENNCADTVSIGINLFVCLSILL